MPKKKIELPEYPIKEDVWDRLAAEKRPIVVYGMGNGADKLLNRLGKYGISVSDFFASDGFVRGHSYRGFRVKSFSEIKETYDDFVILLSFASNRKDVIDMLAEMDGKYEMYAPDMPVSDESEYFDREFYNANYDKIAAVYAMLDDEKSREIYASVLHYRLTGKISFLLDAVSDKAEMYSIINSKRIKTVMDAGAYNGDTVREAMEFFPSLCRAFAIEPDKRNFKKLEKFAEQAPVEIIPVNAALWSSCTLGEFIESGNRNSSVSSTASYQHKSQDVKLITIDSLGVTDADYIKYDVEGAEYEALIGTEKTISASNPVLLISLYHRSRDIFSLPIYIKEKYPEYRFFIRRLPSIPAWELNLIAVPID